MNIKRQVQDFRKEVGGGGGGGVTCTRTTFLSLSEVWGYTKREAGRRGRGGGGILQDPPWVLLPVNESSRKINNKLKLNCFDN